VTEYAEGLEDGGYLDEDEMYDRLAALEEQAAEQAEVDRINATISGMEASYRVELDDEQVQVLGSLIDEYGFDPIQAWNSLDLGPNDLEAEFEDLADTVEQDHGRALTESELQRLWQAQQYADREDHDEVDVSGVLLYLDDSDQRAAYIGEVLRVEPERDEPSKPAINDDGEEVAAFDLDDSTDRAAVIDRMMSGENAAVIDNEEGD
jgi:hypothetical protein